MSHIIQEMQKIRLAEDAVAPVVGKVMGMDSAAKVYSEALDRLGVDHAGVTDSFSLGKLFDMAKSRGRKPRVAMDAAAVTARESMFPNANRLHGG